MKTGLDFYDVFLIFKVTTKINRSNFSDVFLVLSGAKKKITDTPKQHGKPIKNGFSRLYITVKNSHV